MQEAGTYLEEVAESDPPSEVKTDDDFLDSIENERLYQILIEVDSLTLQAVLLKNKVLVTVKSLCGLV